MSKTIQITVREVLPDFKMSAFYSGPYDRDVIELYLGSRQPRDVKGRFTKASDLVDSSPLTKEHSTSQQATPEAHIDE